MHSLVHGKLLIVSFVFSVFLALVCIAYSETEPESYSIQKFWDENINYVFHYQVAVNSCGPACVHMVLDFFDVDPLPSQEELASEMNTTIYEYAYTDYVPQPFASRNIAIVFDGHLDNDFPVALRQLKGNISLNRPAILLMWYDTSNQTSHYRVVTGYNQTGLFFHDPANPEYGYCFYSGPNIFLNNTLVEKLWTKHDNWALILQSSPPYTPQPSPDSSFMIVLLLFFVVMIVGIVVLSYIVTRAYISGL